MEIINRKNPKKLDTRKKNINILKFEKAEVVGSVRGVLCYRRVMRPKDLDEMANSVDPD